MRAVVQRVTSARVLVEGRIVGEIGAGLVAFVGVTYGDGPDDAHYLAGKLADLRIMEDEEGRMNRSVTETGGGILVVPQFTLYGDCRRGRRPSFDRAAAPQPAEQLYEDVVRDLRARGLDVRTGVFQSKMRVELANDGPVTLLLSSEKAF